MKRWIAAVFALMLLVCGVGAQAEAADTRGNWIEPFSGAWPDTLTELMSGPEWASARPLEGYVGMRMGRWGNGAALVQDDQGYILACFTHTDEGWQVTASRAALRQGERATLWNQAVAEGWSAHEISQSDGSEQFEVVYGDARYTWYAGSGGWFLTRVVLPVANVVVGPRTLYWNEEAVFNTQDIMLTGFVEADFPKSLLAAQTLVDASGLDDATQALTTAGNADPTVWQDFPVIMYAAPSAGAEVTAQYATGVAATVLDMGSGFVKLQIGDMAGWVKRDQALLGGERAEQQYLRNGNVAQVYDCGTVRYRSLLAEPREGAAVVATLGVNLRVQALGMLRGDAWLHVMLDDGTMGYMAADEVCQTDNFHAVWITSDKPGNRLNLRESPTTKSQTLGKYYAGTEAARLFSMVSSSEWTRVIVHGRMGWMLNDFLDSSADYVPDMLPPMGTVQGVVNGELNLRAAPDAKAEALGQYANGTKAEILSVVGNWAHVRLRDGNVGFMMLKYLGGEPEGAIENGFALAEDTELLEYGGEVIQPLSAGERVVLMDGRPCVSWRYSEAAAAMVLEEPEQVWVRYGDGCGLVPVSALALDW